MVAFIVGKYVLSFMEEGAYVGIGVIGAYVGMGVIGINSLFWFGEFDGTHG